MIQTILCDHHIFTSSNVAITTISTFIMYCRTVLEHFQSKRVEERAVKRRTQKKG